jgi:SMI1/KNR4 family protein SUKH-1
MKSQSQLQKLIHQLLEAKQELHRLLFDEAYPGELGEPSDPKQIGVVEAILGKPLSPSYRAFLELYNGWSSFAGDAKLLAIEDQRSKWVKERLKSLGFLFQEFEREDPFKEGAIPILLGERERDFLIMDPRTRRPDGEMDFISIDLTKERKRFTDFTSFLLHDLKLTQRLIVSERKGTKDDEEEED